MSATTLFRSPLLSVIDYRCSAGPRDRPFQELHHNHSISYVRKGTFGCQHRGRLHDLVAGGLLIGYPGDEYMCTHEHHGGGDECLSFHFTQAGLNALGHDGIQRAKPWQAGAMPPLPPLMLLAELAQAVVDRDHDIALDELGLLLLGRWRALVSGVADQRLPRCLGRDRQRAVAAALWIEANSQHEIALEDVAQSAGLSPFHFLRVFARVIGVTPHQYLLRCRLRNAARLLMDAERSVTEVAIDVGFADLSNFVRTFRRAAGVSPGVFGELLTDRKILQERLAQFA